MQDTGIGKYIHRVPETFIERVIKYLNVWAQNNVRLNAEDGVLPQKQHGIPAYVVRFDCAPPNDYSDPAEVVYELEHDPGGLGMLMHMEETILGNRGLMHKALMALQEKIGQLLLFQPPHYDHAVLAEDLQLMARNLNTRVVHNTSALNEHFFFARGTSEDIPISFQPRALTSGQNGKGFMPILFPDHVFFAKHEIRDRMMAGGVLKPTLGHWGQDVCIMPTNTSAEAWKKRPTRKTWEQAVDRALQDSYKSWIWQSFIAPKVMMQNELDVHSPPPDSTGVNSVHFLILRIFFVYIPNEGWQYAGGVWSARPSLVVHGARNSIFGLVT